MILDPAISPRVYGVPAGAEFPEAVVLGLREGFLDHPPEVLASARLIVTTRNMARSIRAHFDEGPALLLPKITLLSDFGDETGIPGIPDPVSPLKRRLELAGLISALLDARPDMAPRTSLYDLADSLSELMDEMHGEDVSPDLIGKLDIADQSGHWKRIQSFLGIVGEFFDSGIHEPDSKTRQNLVMRHYSRLWTETPPNRPVLIAGSTGSRGSSRQLMKTVAKLPKGAVILPGFDFEMPRSAWDALLADPNSQDHPQHRFARLMTELDGHPVDVKPWPGSKSASNDRGRLISLALRPAPVTDQWMIEGPKLRDIAFPATEKITFVEAPSARKEALAIAMRMRKAVNDGETAALLTDDRDLARRVVCALDHWDIIPNESARKPLHHTLQGRFARHLADLFRNRLGTEHLLTVLKHPMAHSGGGRSWHLGHARNLEIHLRKRGMPYPAAGDIMKWTHGRRGKTVIPWAKWVCSCLIGLESGDALPLAERVSHHIELAEKISSGSMGGASRFWETNDGRAVRNAIFELEENARFSANLDAADYSSLFLSVLSGKYADPASGSGSGIYILGSREAFAQKADLYILAGLNEGAWPTAPGTDPWLNRALRRQAGLLMPERKIGLSAHDFQQASLGSEVWLTRSLRSDDAETVPSRWINRLVNLLTGLPDGAGTDALRDMRSRGTRWLDLADMFEESEAIPPAIRPSPCPPVPARPKKLSVTEIRTLIRDPYAIYARHVLGLKPLDPLKPEPDALLRGVVLHAVFENVIKASIDNDATPTRESLVTETIRVSEEKIQWAAARSILRARMERVADHFLAGEQARQAMARPKMLEVKASANLPELDFTITAKADRIDVDESGGFHIYDYKTGAPPSKARQLSFDKQLLIEAALAEIAGFGDFPPSRVERAVYIGLGGNPADVNAPLETEPVSEVWKNLGYLIAAYMNPVRGYTSRRAMRLKGESGNYDHLARFGEWEISDKPVSEILG
ncbi:MAG: double-strand break repair protein AddB [Roseovarius sp.]|nr:double-strand break repair protein AddB [Roseovarius sp.]